ncbi:Cof-type HAD-IIB family hydrolase [Nocardia salmonicida]|uniref:Cof-type HAD-IIB family hydrolase n=1 Tax=Nocardia salmonicida TaxID=53431 RepID=UPI00366F955B
MTLPRLIATDLDGTLLRADGTVSQRTLDAVRTAIRAGVEIVVVTARPPRYLDALVAAAGLTGTAVCSNGALVYDIASRTVVESRALSVAAARTVASAVTGAVEGVGFAVETGHRVFFEPGYRPRLTQDTGAESPVRALADLWTLDAPIVKLLAYSARHDADFLVAAAEESAPGAAQFTHSGGRGLLEISAPGVTKAGTLAELCAERGIAADDVYAFGDMPNDLTILNWAGTGYAMGNAHASVRAAVARHTASNEEDGVAVVIERLFEHL